MTGKQWWREGYACDCLITVVEEMVEPRMIAAGYIKESIEIYQQSYNSSVSASAGTHGGGGAIDTQRYGSTGELTIWRECGVAYWPRGNDLYGDGFDPHCHGIVIGCPHLSGDAADQVADYKAGRNGLANNGPDPGPDVPYVTWQDAYAAYDHDEGLFGMTQKLYQRRSTDYAAKCDGEWHDLYINEDADTSVVIGQTDQVTCSGLVLVAGLVDGEAFDLTWRIASYDPDQKPTVYAHTRDTYARAAGVPGRTVSVGRTYNGSVPKDDDGNSPRLRLSYRTTAADATITSVTVEGWATE